MASARFMAGPAAATSAMSRRGWCMRRGSIGTGLAQPRKNPPGISRQSSGRMTVPNGSMCASGFMVSRPWSLAVGSPHR